MPNVGGKKFPYTPEGMMAAKRAAVGMRGGGSVEGAAESKMIMQLIQKMAQEEAETGAVKRGNMVAAMEADESGMSDRDMDLINQALGRGVTKSVRPQARPQGMMYGGEAKKGKVQKYKGGGCVMAGRGMKKTKMS
mgnify:FL=1|jgi:hypothetical protein